jgi:NADH dehydrogenase/NADH:ubiquinone oxidoreductase subunit G
MATHPVDVAMTLAPGLGLAAKGAKVAGLGRTANVLKVAGEMTDPVNAVTKPFAAVSDKFAGNAALREMRNAAPSFEEVASQKNAAYSTLENAGIQFDPQAYNQMLHDTAQKVGKFSEARAPLANDMMNQLVSHDGTAPSFSTVEEMLSSAKGILREPGASNADKAAAHHIVDNLNGFFDNAPLTTNGSIAPGDVSSLAGQARELARRHILARDLAEMERKSEWYVSGKESGMRNQAAAYGKRNGKGLTPEEDKALRKVAGREGIRDIIMKTGNGLSQHIVPGLLGGAGSTMGPYGAVAGYGLGLGVNQAA